MNKKLEAAANEYCKKQNLMWDFVNDLTNKDAVKSFIAGASYGRKEALIEAIAEFEEKEKLGKPYSWTYHLCINELKQLLSKE